MSGFVLKLCAPRKYIFKIRFMFQSNKNSIDFSKDNLFTVNLKIEKCQLYIIKDVGIIKTLGKAGRLIEIGGVGTRTPSGQPWNLHRIQGFYLSYQNPLHCRRLSWIFEIPVENCCILWRLSSFVHLWDSFHEPAVLYPFHLIGLLWLNHQTHFSITSERMLKSSWRNYFLTRERQVAVHLFH